MLVQSIKNFAVYDKDALLKGTIKNAFVVFILKIFMRTMLLVMVDPLQTGTMKH